MTINNIKDLSKLIDLARKKGLESIEVDGIKFKLGHKETKHKSAQGPELESVETYSDEEILHWSSTPLDGVG
jgi:hypothetical protein